MHGLVQILEFFLIIFKWWLVLLFKVIWCLQFFDLELTYVVCSDIANMYRQVLIKPEYRCLQLNWWRLLMKKCLHTYCLNTLHNMVCTSTKTIRRDLYVDELITSYENVDDVIIMCFKRLLVHYIKVTLHWENGHPILLQCYRRFRVQKLISLLLYIKKIVKILGYYGLQISNTDISLFQINASVVQKPIIGVAFRRHAPMQICVNNKKSFTISSGNIL